MAKDDDPHRVERLARIRFVYERLLPREVMVFADELEIHLLPKVGYAWMPKGTQVEVMMPGTHEKHYLAGALELSTGTLHHGRGPRKTNGLFRELLQRLDDILGRQPAHLHLVRIKPHPHRILSGAEYADGAHAGKPRDFVLQADGGEIAEIEAVVAAVRRVDRQDLQDGRRLLLDGRPGG